MNHRMKHVLPCLCMVPVLLLTSFVTNVYAAKDFPTPDLGVPSSVVGASGQFREVKITLSGFPGQTGESVTNIGLRPSPCHLENDVTCNGLSNIMVRGIGEGSASASVWFAPVGSLFGIILLCVVASGQNPSRDVGMRPCEDFVNMLLYYYNSTRTIDIPGIGTGQATVQLS
jgi:hypothetical protein